MAPTSSPPREDPSSEVSSIRQRQLAPTVGPEASGGRNREGSAMGSYDDSIAVGRVLYAGNFPIVPPDEFWIPARSNPVKLSIVPIGGIHIFIGETVDSDGNALVSNADASAAELDAVAKIRSESQELLKEDSALDQEKSKPTQSAPEQEKTVEDQCRSAWVSQVLEKQRCHFVHFLAHTAGDALHQDEADPLQVEGPGNNVAPDLPEAVGDSDAPGQEEAGNPEESILGNLSPNSDDASSIGTEEYNRLTKELAIGEEDDGASSMNTEEFNRKLEELGGGEQAEVESAQPMQVLATVAPLDQPDTEDEASNSDPGPSNVRSGGLRSQRQEMLATAQKFAGTAAAMLEERTIAANFVDHFQKKDREVDESLEKVRQLEKHWEAKVKFVQEEEARIRREAILPRKITFATPTEQQPLATPKDNMKKAAELLKKKDEEIDINYVRKLVASAMQQQSKADTSRRLASNPEQCISTAQKDAIPSQHRDDESRTGSTERRRKVRDHPNPIPVPSDSAPKDPTKGKDAMYTGRDKYRVPSPPPRASRPPLPPRRRSPAGNPRPHGPGGINIRDSMPAPRDRNRERTLEQRRSRNQDREPEPRRNQERDPEPRRSQGRDPEPRRSRNEEYAPEPRRSRNDGGDHHQEERSHRSRSQPREPRRESEGGRTSYRPPRRSPSPPPSGGGGGGGGRGRRSRSRSKSPGGAPRDARDRLNEYRSDYIGPRCFGQMIREEPKPRSLNLKLPGNLKHYDGSERPDTWIEDYYNAVTFAGGTPNIACRMLQLYLIGPARVWLSDLEENTIFCWLDLKKAFENHFRGTYKRPATTSDLQACIQKKGETSRSFLTRWLATRNECENVDNRTAMHAFIGGLQRGGLLRHKLTCLVNANKLTLDEMINIASDHTAADDDAGGDLAATAIPLHQQKKNRDNGVSNSNKRKNPPEDQKGGGSDMVAMTFQRGGPGGGRGRGRGGGAGRGQQRADEVTAAGSRAPQTYEEYRDMPCLAHLDPATGKSTHTNRNCKWVNDLKNDPEAGYKRARKHRPRGKGGKGKNKDKEEDSSEAMDEDDASPEPKEGTAANKSNPFGRKSVGTYHTFLGTPTVRAKKSALRILNATVPAVPQYVKWSEKACTFDRSDHPAVIPKECYALVVSPRIDGYDFSKCLMDGGASLNIMYLETLEKMNLTKEQLKHSTTEFHGVVPGKKANSLGSIKLPVAFGNVNNYREEMITFEVVPFKSSYHVIFGRPTYHKFHARACYIYNKLKIPGPNGWITVSGDYKKARDCEEGEAAFAESVISGEELQGYRAAVDPTEMQTTKKQISEQKTSFKAAIETKKHDLVEGATYQRTMQRCLKDQIGRNVHAYVDDIAVMTRKGSDLLSDLKETFDNLRRYKMMLNPLKCVFGVPAGKLLGFIRYPHFQKLAYGVFLGSRKLRHYFQEHPMTVVSKAPLATIINNSDATGRVAKWGIELSAFDINYEARTAIKSQVLADFIADWTEAPEGTPVPEPEAWVMHFDGSKQHQGSGAGVTLKSPTGEELQYVLQIHFEATNNMAEYEALLHGLRIAKEIGIKHIICCGDSDLVAQQVAGTWNARNSVMAAYRDEVDEIAKCFLGYEVKYVRRDDNTAADMLSKLGSGRKPIPPGIFLEHLRVPSVKGANPENPDLAVSPAKEVMAVIPAWTQPFLDYLIDQKLPEDEVHARQIIRRARSYTIVDGQLYKRSANGVFLKCVSSQDGIEILREIHAGDCGHHAAPRSLVAKAFRLGFYWLTAKEDADKLVKTCRGCQYYATQPNAPAQELKTIPITWPFAVWGLDMVAS
ncbi:hypothetical protein QYE76_016750 [Lolium multiflorum]|uniref:Uncharacterized protein n=1 Tax=Lolium multiflorum TaxID=4521 RepID=A0AAD8V2G9_LOLMU|nr:hypothetical protein QYE76_016750 [Lolium multiflorum]